MGKVFLVNAGSSSVKWKLFEASDESVIAKGLVERINMPGSVFEVKYGSDKYEIKINNLSYEKTAELIFEKLQELKIISDLAEIEAVGHRIVAGGEQFKSAVELTEDNLNKLSKMKDFAPLHNPMEIKYVKIMQHTLPEIPQYAVFDSQFFTDLPEKNAIFSIPYKYTKEFGIRRYGEHGISHEYISHRAADLLDKPLESLKMITLHLGSGASVAAEKDGKAFDTSMGFTPLTGLTMGTRAGDVDPSIIPYLMKKLSLDLDDILLMLNKESGLLGVSGLSSDMRDLLANSEQEQIKLAIDIFINRIVKYVGSYYAELGGLDVLVFAGGIGENNRELRKIIVKKLQVLGLKINQEANEANAEGVISAKDSAAKIMVVPTNEELSMVRQITALRDK
ncbi:acetate/propionate family kinase [Liquorilactobacillus hordei]|uniref:Acetate kinase n=1 Tax=Liquorilactobacillus hordei DSM 19519 TaxID=1423759 RepID=A0A0R1MSD3_9LACO|nr:acetate kinase [Liquorilactobacillus hordei]KRL08082.1 acetate kinase [Liquorilactobacillus hordei DSM 19519]QYH51835.1 acetate kinase [Liquorilactobacillus hordei DSM 19519]